MKLHSADVYNLSSLPDVTRRSNKGKTD